jgi:hypothetical protein
MDNVECIGDHGDLVDEVECVSDRCVQYCSMAVLLTLRHYVTSRKVGGFNPDKVIGFFFQFTGSLLAALWLSG